MKKPVLRRYADGDPAVVKQDRRPQLSVPVAKRHFLAFEGRPPLGSGKQQLLLPLNATQQVFLSL